MKPVWLSVVLLACSTPAPLAGDDDQAPPPPVESAGMAGLTGAAGMAVAMAGAPDAQSDGDLGGEGGAAPEKTGAAGAAQSEIAGAGGVVALGGTAGGLSGGGGAPFCCSGMYNLLGQCVVVPSMNCAGAPGVAGSSPASCMCGLWLCPAPCVPNAFGECNNPSTVERSGCHINPDDFAGCQLVAPQC